MSAKRFKLQAALILIAALLSTAALPEGTYAALPEGTYAALPQPAASQPPRVAVLYSDPADESKAAEVLVWLGHYEVTPTLVELASSTAVSSDDPLTMEMEHADYVIYVDGGDESILRHVQEFSNAGQVPFLRIGTGEPTPASFQAISVEYKGKSYPEAGFQVPLLPGSGREEVLAAASDGSRQVPLVQRSKLQWTAVVERLDGIFGYLIADLLHDFLGQPHVEEHTGFVMVQNVNPTTSPAKLRETAELFREYKLPFLLALTPVYKDPVLGETVYLQESPELLEALHHAEESGGSIIMAGLTHQDGMGRTGSSYEFWDVPRDRALENEAEVIGGKLNQGIALLIQAGLKPSGFTVPMHASSRRGYGMIGRHFTSFYGKLQQSDLTYGMVHEIPYRVKAHGLEVYPENLGAVSGQRGDVERLADRLRRLMLVRDGFAGATVRIEDPADQIRSALNVLKNRPMTMVDPPLEIFSVQTAFASVSSDGSGTMKAAVTDPQRLNELSRVPDQESDWLSSFTWLLTWGIAAVVSVFVIFFAGFVYLLNRRRRYRLFAERSVPDAERQ